MNSSGRGFDEVTEEMFTNAVRDELRRDIGEGANPGQYNTIFSPTTASLFVVAGPGSGKTTVMTLRVLKIILINKVDPRSIILTTFTKKAASELESRVLGWGDRLRLYFIQHGASQNLKKRLEGIDYTRIYVGTIDSLAQDIMAEFKQPGQIEPVVIEDFVSTALMLRYGLFANGRHNSRHLEDLLLRIKDDNSGTINARQKANILTKIKDRIYTDVISTNSIRGDGQDVGRVRLAEAIEAYQQELDRRNLFDFGRLESVFLEKLNAGELDVFLNGIKFIMVDEYQDTNLLQERIYFRIASRAISNGGGITVVGDDDQSLYRFRGATVELFRDFPQRLHEVTSTTPTVTWLSINYRSTPQIIDFVNNFVNLDPDFQNVRVNRKPRIIQNQNNGGPRSEARTNYPILGMFRGDINTLARDLANFIQSVVSGPGYQINGGLRVQIDQTRGSSSDLAILMYSPSEMSSGGDSRLPLLIKERLEGGTPKIRIFNPRGKDLSSEELIMRLNGLILESIDQGSQVQNSITKLPREIRDTLVEWRQVAGEYLQNHGADLVRNKDLAGFVTETQHMFSGQNRNQAIRTVQLTALIYNLISWMPDFHNDILGLAYLELVTRAIEQSSIIDPDFGNVTAGGQGNRLQTYSIREAIWNIFVPIAANAVDLNEDLFETLPPDRLNIMSFHQAKGLEFPLVIVDVGSEFRLNHWRQAFKRYPIHPGETSGIERFVRNFSPLGLPTRTGTHPAFDDLIRDYFVGFSRAQDCLLLVGLDGSINGNIQNVATGWLRNGTRNWNVLGGTIEYI